MVEISIVYQGDLRCEAIHTPSGTVIVTDAPRDNHGKAESFSPTDLMATALGTCIMTVMGIAARKRNLDISGSTVVVNKTMITKPERRIGELAVVITVPHALDDATKEVLKTAALSCPVHHSMHPDIAMPLTFNWG